MNFRINILILFILPATLYILLQYFTARTETIPLIAEYVFLFSIYLYTLWVSEKSRVFKAGLIFAIIFRLLLIPGVPNLSDDFYRFIWDGHLTILGIDTYNYTPRELVALYPNLLDKNLFALLNSPDYHSVYPPLLQGLFAAVVWLAQDSIWISTIIFKSVILIAELASISLLMRLCSVWNLEKKAALIYALNPLVIIELTGNIHFEALAIPFVLFAILLASRNQALLSGMALSISAGLKLLPALFAPTFFAGFNRKSRFFWAGAFVAGLVLTLIGLVVNFSGGIGSGLDLYFRKFEFNASFYYLAREIGFWIKGYNTIAFLGPAFGLLTLFLISGISGLYFFKKIRFEESLLFSLAIFLMLATTVHPWYIIPLLAISCFSKFRFPIVWSFLIFFTYAGYSESGFTENTLVVIGEYFITFGFALWEIMKNLWKRTAS